MRSQNQAARVGLVCLLGLTALAPRLAAADESVPVFFAPLAVDAPFTADAQTVRILVVAGVLQSGPYAEAVSGEAEAQLDECVRETAKGGEPSCWIQVGLGRAARLLVSGSVRGTADSCTVTLRMTELETRVSPRVEAHNLAPCTRAALLEHAALAAVRLAKGQEPAAAPDQLPGATLHLSATPADALFELSGPDGYTAGGSLPANLDQVPAGLHTVTLRRPGSVALDDSFNVAPGSTVRCPSAVDTSWACSSRR